MRGLYDRIALTRSDNGQMIFVFIDHITWMEKPLRGDGMIVHTSCAASLGVDESEEYINSFIDGLEGKIQDRR